MHTDSVGFVIIVIRLLQVSSRNPPNSRSQIRRRPVSTRTIGNEVLNRRVFDSGGGGGGGGSNAFLLKNTVDFRRPGDRGCSILSTVSIVGKPNELNKNRKT